jgi:prevent-host-death family protein
MVMYNNHNDHMKVKIAELKTHLSKYVQSVREGGEPIEVCVREQTVAYLTKVEAYRPSSLAGERDLAERLQRKGLLLVKAGHLSTRRLEPGLPGDGKNPANSVVTIRNEKEW